MKNSSNVTMSNKPKWARAARNKWEYRGQKRPSFAVEPKEGEESVWDYPRPPVIENDEREVVVMFDEHQIAKTTHAKRVLETASPPTFYIPPEDVDTAYLTRSNNSSRCEWKGEATYWHLKTDQRTINNAAWTYQQPFDEFKELEGYFAFYPGKLNCYVDSKSVKAQPGGFYGGWITPEIVGPVKGEFEETYK